MRFPRFKRKPRRNTDSGPPTALFSFDREREREMVTRSGSLPAELIEARYRLIDEVLEYRRTGQLTQALLEACDAEAAVAGWARSAAMRRLGQLATDGHAVAADRLDTLSRSPEWQVRLEAFQTLFCHSDGKARREVQRRALTDRSARIRRLAAEDAAFAHLIDMADEIERAASCEAKEKDARAIYWFAWHLTKNQRTGNCNSFSEDEVERVQFDADWARFRETCAFAKGT